uniref:GDSL esterase/lipase EXL3 n=1 Tax=Kalanchoe fedtschenkoi TaxID=63787 RepID=A0A7N0ZQY9_KALFE
MARLLSSELAAPLKTGHNTLLRLTAACLAPLLWFPLIVSASGVDIPEDQKFPALIAFGDSIVDPGNNNGISTLVKANFPPYGKNFREGPTGRFSNGKVPTDLIAEELSIKELVPAYLDPNLQPSDLITGVSFASGASGYDPLTPKIASVISLSQQLDYFKEYISKLRSLVGEDQTNYILARSLFLVVAGSDDLANTYFSARARQLEYDIPAYTDLMANEAAKFYENLYEMGARRIGVLSAPPIGCLPSQRTLGGAFQGRPCIESYNQAAKLYNSKLQRVIDSFNTKNTDARAHVFDIYNPIFDLVQNPAKNGFEVVDRGCCGTGDIEVSVLCNRLNPLQTCSDPTKYIFWDSYHPTETAYKLLVDKLLKKGISALFF